MTLESCPKLGRDYLAFISGVHKLACFPNTGGYLFCCSVDKSFLDSLRPHGLQHTRLLCPSLSPGVCSNSCPELVMPSNHLILCCPLLLPSSGSFPMSQLFTLGGQSMRASASVLPMNIQGWFPLGLTGLISLVFKGLSRVFSRTTVWKHQFFGTQPFFGSTLTSI